MCVLMRLVGVRAGVAVFVNTPVTSQLESRKGGSLRQQSIYNYSILMQVRSHERGLTKVESDFEHSPEHSILWGDRLRDIPIDLFEPLPDKHFPTLLESPWRSMGTMA
jgi:hypothetical protein